MYSRFHTNPMHKLAYSKISIHAMAFIRENYGKKGFYAGFAPSLLIYGATYWEDLNRMVFSKVR